MARQGNSNVFTGPLLRTAGPRFGNYRTSDLVQPPTTVDSSTVTFINASQRNGSLPAVDQMKPITRFLFAHGGTLCL